MQDQLLEYIVINNPEAVSQRLGILGYTDGEYYGPEELHNGIVAIATANMDESGGDPAAYWDVAANIVDVPLNPNGPYASELQQAINFNSPMPSGGGFGGKTFFVGGGITRADIIDFLTIVALLLLIGNMLFGRGKS